MKIRPLFEKYQKPLLQFVNTSIGKGYLGIKTKNKIVKISPDSWHELLGFNKDEIILNATFLSKSPYIGKFRKVLSVIETLDNAKNFLESMPDRGAFLIDNILTSPIPLLALTSTPFYPDANPESTSCDGWAYRNYDPPVAFSTIRSLAGTAGSASNTFYQAATTVASTSSNLFWQLCRSFFLFDTSALTSVATKISGNFRLYILDDESGTNTNICLVDTNPASNTNIVASDYGNTGTTQQASDIATSSMTDNSYSTWTLNGTGLGNVSLTGITKFGLKTANDRVNSAPSWSGFRRDGINSNFSDNITNVPTLNVTYTLPITTPQAHSVLSNSKTTYYSGMNYDWKPAGTEGAQNRGFNS